MSRFRLASISPNPFRAATEITYAVPSGEGQAAVRIAIYDCRGRHVRTLIDAEKAGGMHHAVWDGRDHMGHEMASGIYYCRATSGGISISRQIVLLR
jgi:flagellar hook assembly protein FlgD